ncbi:MAG: K+/H+ antiporter subunit F [Rhodomicrobiaceae bacterium]
MIAYSFYFAFGCFGLALLFNLWRIVYAPGVGDRILALDTLVINSIALVTLYGIQARTMMYFEVAMVIAMVGFVSTVAYCRYMLRGDIIE